MAKAIVMDEFHLTIYAPRGLPKSKYDALRQALEGPLFQADLRRAIRDTFLRQRR
jgi:hypothetical protein